MAKTKRLGDAKPNIRRAPRSVPTAGQCPVCLEPTTKINQCYERTVRDLAISGRRVLLHVRTYQFECERCKRLFYEQFSFVDQHQQMTRRYEHYLYQRCIGVEIQYVVVQEDVCWKTVDRIFKQTGKRQRGSIRIAF